MSFEAMRWAAARPLPAMQKLVLLMLAERANDAGACWPSLPQIAADCGLSQRAVQNALGKLAEANMLRRDTRPGRGVVYTLSVLAPPTLAPGAILPQHDVPPTLAPGATHPSTRCHPPQHDVPPTLAPGATKPIKEPKKERKSSLRSPRARAEPTEFDAWWEGYPRKVGRDAAEKAYASAVKRGASHAALAEALQRQEWPDEDRFIPHAATWLNQGRWKDEAAPPRQRAPPSRRPAQNGAVELLLRAKERNASDPETPRPKPELIYAAV